MLASERREKIFEMITEEGSVRTAALSVLFGVSEVTIRQDLDKLAASGRISRGHGGAFCATVPEQVRTMTLARSGNRERKMAIGAAAAQLVQPGQQIILDAGSTTTSLAETLLVTPLTVITNALNIALILGSRPGVDVMVTGGDFKAPTLSLTGDKAGAFFENIHVDTLFLATAGFDLDAGLTYPGLADLPVKRAMIAAASKVYLVADSSKFGVRAFARLGPLEMVHGIVTDSAIDSAVRERLAERGIEVIIA